MAQLRQEVDPGEAGLDPRVLDRMDRHFAGLVDEGRLPGFLVSVARAGRVAHLATHGLRDIAAGLPVEPGTLWRVYSMTKPVTAVAALLLVEESGCRWTTRSPTSCRPSPSPACTSVAPGPTYGPARPTAPYSSGT